MLFRRLFIVAIASTALLGSAAAQEKAKTPVKEQSERPFFGPQQEPSSLTKIKASRMSVSELRQSRALLKADQRRARMERNAWMGYEPLRPTFNTVPMMRSRYENRTIFVPVYSIR